MDAGCSRPDPTVAAREQSSSVYLSIISQQTFIGCWKLNTELSSLLKVSLHKLQNSAPVKVTVSFIHGFVTDSKRSLVGTKLLAAVWMISCLFKQLYL